MTVVEKMLEEWESYLPELTKEDDFDEFWEETINATREVPLNARLEKYDYPSDFVDVYDLRYNGYDSTNIHGWYLVPKLGGGAPYPCLIHYHGFGGDRGLPHDFMPWIMQGVAVVAVDVRDQSGETGNAASYCNGAQGSVYNRGILDHNEYYVRAVYMDCLKAIDFACEQDEVDKDRIVLEGGSQGGALVMAMAALDDRAKLAMADVPSNTNLEARVQGNHGAYGCVHGYLKGYPDRYDQCMKTLSYFDTMNMADRIACDVFVSVGGMDPICPPKMYFATHNRITSSKEVHVYPFNGHEGGGRIHMEKKLRRLRGFLSK